MSTGVFPERWKQANIIPIFKKGDKKLPQNYRSVSLLCLFGKVLERVVYDQLSTHVASVMCSEQHGFIPKRSCVTNLAVYLKSAWEAISEGYQMDAIYTDYSAAFQSINHELVIHKLKHSYQIQDSALKWFVSYLSDRRQRVIVNGKVSDWRPVTSGVPEGAILAPLIFSMYINDLPNLIQSGCLMYADDVKLFRKITSPADARLLQDDLDRLTAWSFRWGLTLNPSKCKSLTMTLRREPVRTNYSIGTSALELVEEIRDLGVIIDSKLTFSSHVDSVVKRANRCLGLLIRSFQTGLTTSRFNRKALLAAYYSNVRSILEYCSVVWAGAADSHKVRVDRVQHKFLLWLLHNTPSRYADSLSYECLLRHFKIPSLAARRVQHDLLFIRNILSGSLDVPSLLSSFPFHVPARSTRNQTLFHIPHARVNTVRFGFLCRLPRLCNEFLFSRDSEADIFMNDWATYRNHVVKYVAKL